MLIFKTQKMRDKYKLVLASILVACLVCASTIFAAHSFSHQFELLQGAKNSQEAFGLKNSPLSPIISQKEDFSTKKRQSHDLASCSMCFLSQNYHNILFFAAISVAFFTFYLLFIAKISDRVKLAYLSTSFLSRAPPFVS